MKKIPLQKLKSNLAEICLEFSMQALCSYMMLQAVGVIYPLEFYRGHFANLQKALKLTGILSVLLAKNLVYGHQDVVNRAFTKKINDLKHAVTLKNITRWVVPRLAMGISVGLITGGVANVWLRLVGLMYPERLVTGDLLKEVLEENETARLENVVHVPLAEETYSRGLLMNGARIVMHGLYIIGTNYISADAQVPVTNTEENEQDDECAIEQLNKNVNTVANLCVAAEFALGHLPVQQPYSFFMGWCNGNLTNRFGDTGAGVTAHMVHNLINTTFPVPLLEATGRRLNPS